jgi:hypothetical protein
MPADRKPMPPEFKLRLASVFLNQGNIVRGTLPGAPRAPLRRTMLPHTSHEPAPAVWAEWFFDRPFEQSSGGAQIDIHRPASIRQIDAHLGVSNAALCGRDLSGQIEQLFGTSKQQW